MILDIDSSAFIILCVGSAAATGFGFARSYFKSEKNSMLSEIKNLRESVSEHEKSDREVHHGMSVETKDHSHALNSLRLEVRVLGERFKGIEEKLEMVLTFVKKGA